VIRVANAPVSFGVFELTAGGAGGPDPDELLGAIAAAGYEGTELGPPGYLGEGDALRRRLERHGLELTGGYVPIRFAEPDLGELSRTLDLFEAAGAAGARPVLADAGREHDVDFERLAAGVRRAAALARDRGFEPAFHHHLGTNVETPAELERLLDATDVPLLLDTGHLLAAGGDPVEALRRRRERIDYVHLKDVRLGVLREVADEGAELLEAWRRGAFCELGAGDVDLRAFVAELRRTGYDGWLVVEQDRIPRAGEPLAEAAGAQARNRAWLRANAGV
jgi:inosose dehydratase